VTVATEGHFKDAILDRLAQSANVAQFASFAPGTEPAIRFARVHGYEHDDLYSLEEAVGALLANTLEGSVNVRSFDPRQPKSHDFVYGIRDAERAATEVRRLAAAGLYTIVNETIDVDDGGVSGVIHGGVVEFAPGDTPRCVDKPGTASFPRPVGLSVLETVYGFRPALDYSDELRIEFSIHPLKRGVRHDHTIVWEEERTEPLELRTEIVWPNRFSRFLGDKPFGLLVADALGLRVPRTTVVSRRIAPFAFGTSTSSGEHWLRTAPPEQAPGHFTTTRGWGDPFALLANEDPSGDAITSVLAQEGVEAAYSGAAAAGADGGVVVEGVAGLGDEFMLGIRPPQELPDWVLSDVRAVHSAASTQLGPVRMEWVHDGRAVWIVQLHRGRTASAGRVVYPGEAHVEHRFRVGDGLEALRSLVSQVEGTGDGIVLVGSVGVTSHLGDVLRRARIPSRIEEPAEAVRV
jgi:hypothetical protein